MLLSVDADQGAAATSAALKTLANTATIHDECNAGPQPPSNEPWQRYG